jgi:mannosyltransferase
MIAGLVLNLLGCGFALIFNSASQRPKTWLTNFLIARMDAVIATSEMAAQYILRPATVIHHGIDVELYSPPADRRAAFAATGLPGQYAIGTFGRVRRQKGSDLFVEAMCTLLPRYPDFTAVVIGLVTVDNRPFVDGLKQRIAAAGLTERILFLGELPIEEVPLWYQRITIYVFASRVEGFGLTMLEAMAAGDAVVATRAGAAEMVIADGDDGVLAPVGDAEALAAALEPLMRDPERIEEIGRRAREKVVRLYSRDREADEISAVYRQVWAARSKAP